METSQDINDPGLDKDTLTIEIARKIIDIESVKEWQELCSQMELHIAQLIKNTESREFVKEVSQNPTVFADNVAFRRGIRHVLEYPRLLRRRAERASQKLSERSTVEEN